MNEAIAPNGNGSTDGPAPESAESADQRFATPADWHDPVEADGGAGITELLAILGRHRWAAIIAGLVALGIGTGVVFGRTPVYSCAPAVLQIVSDSSRIATVGDVFRPQDATRPYFDTQISLVKLWPVMRTSRSRVPDVEAIPYDDFVEAVKVMPDRRSYLIRIAFESPDAELNAKVANAIAETFIETVRQERSDRTSRATSLFARQREVQKKRLEEVEQRIDQFRTDSHVADVRAAMARVDSRLGAVYVNLDARKVALVALERSFSEAKAAREANDLTLVSDVRRDRGYQQIERAIGDAEARRFEVLKEFDEKSPQVRLWGKQIDSLRAQSAELAAAIVGQLESAYKDGLTAVERLEESRSEGRVEQLRLHDLMNQLTNLESERTRARADLDQLMAQANVIQGATEFDTAPAILWERARPVLEPVRPKPVRDMGIVAFIAVASGLGLAFALNQFDDAVHSAEAVVRATGLPILGTLPLVPGKNGEGDLATLLSPSSEMAEAIRLIRTSIFHTEPGRPARKTLLVTSAAMGEGKTLTSVNLAVAIAQSGRRTLLIDCDLRHPSLHQVFGLDNTQGLTHIFANGASTPPAARPSDRARHLEVTTTGPRVPHPGELLGSRRMRAFLDQVARDYETVVIDAPPAGPVSDPSTLAQHVDGVIFVVESGRTRLRALKRAHGHLLAVGAPVLGVVFNRAAAERGYYAYS